MGISLSRAFGTDFAAKWFSIAITETVGHCHWALVREHQIRGEPAFGRIALRRNLVFGGSAKDPDHEAVIGFSSKAPRRRAHSHDGK